MDGRNFANGFHFGYNGMAYMAGIPIDRLFQIPQIPVLQRALMYQHTLLNGYKPFIQSSSRASTPSLEPSQERPSRASTPSLDQSQQCSSRESSPSLEPSRPSSRKETPPRLSLFPSWKSETSDQSDDEDEDRLIIDLSPQKSPAKEASVPTSPLEPSQQSSSSDSPPSLDQSQQSSSRPSTPSLDTSHQRSPRSSTPSLNPSQQGSPPESPPRLSLFQPWKSEASDERDDEDEDRLIIDLSSQKSPAKEASVPTSPMSEAPSQSSTTPEALPQRRNLTEASIQDNMPLTPPLDGSPPLEAQREVPGNDDSEDEQAQPLEKKQRTSDTPKTRGPHKKPDERKYTCRYCDKSFTRTNTRRSHEMRHTGAMPYGCDTCGRRFRQKSNLDRHHLTVHTDLKPFSCRVCHRDFNRAFNLRKHHEIHVLKLEEGRGVCLVCGREFARLAEAVDHIAEEQCVPTPEQRA